MVPVAGRDAYRAVAAELEEGSSRGVPMSLGGQIATALNLYGSGATKLITGGLGRGAGLGRDMCTGIPINAAQVGQQEQPTEQLQRALDSRVPIEQAKGIVADARQQSVDLWLGPDPSAHQRTATATLRPVAEANMQLGLRVATEVSDRAAHATPR